VVVSITGGGRLSATQRSQLPQEIKVENREGKKMKKREKMKLEKGSKALGFSVWILGIDLQKRKASKWEGFFYFETQNQI
jgi:hypothetical protein